MSNESRMRRQVPNRRGHKLFTKVLAFERLESRRLLADWVVTNVNDFGSGAPGENDPYVVGSLSWAIDEVNQAGLGSIKFSVDAVTLHNGTQPAINASPVTVDGTRPNNGRASLQSDATSTVFPGLKVAGGGIATIKNLKITQFDGNALEITGGTTITVDNSILSNSLRGIQFQAQASLALTNSFVYGNAAEGVNLVTTGGIVGSVSEISGNGIGRSETGAANGNGFSGIYIGGGVSRDVRIANNNIWENGALGTTEAAGKRNDGISVASTQNTNGIEIRNDANHSFRGNDQLAIDLADNGETSNDRNDSDVGANNLLNYPEIVPGGINLNPGGSWNVQVRYDTDHVGTYDFEFYKFNPVNNEYTFLKNESKSVNLLNNEGPDLVFNTNFSAGSLQQDELITAIAIGGVTAGPNYRRTSEFAPPTTITRLPPQVTDVKISNSSATSPHSYSFDETIDELMDVGIQLLAVPVNEANIITIRFSESVTIDGAQDFALYA
jgi:Right handed beta helix region